MSSEFLDSMNEADGSVDNASFMLPNELVRKEQSGRIQEIDIPKEVLDFFGFPDNVDITLEIFDIPSANAKQIKLRKQDPES
jgi:hypothetical protein